MNKKLQIAFGMTIALASFAILHFTFPLGFEIMNKNPMYMDPRFMEATSDGFAISTSNVEVIGIYLIEPNGITLDLGNTSTGFISMDDPLPILQKIFPENEITSIAVLADGLEIPIIHKEGTLQFDVNNNNQIIIIGFSKI